MDNMRKFLIRRCLAVLGSLTLIVSCVNEDYDLTKIKLDSLSGLKGVAAPVGSTDRFVLKDIVPEDLGDFGVIYDNDGNLMLSMAGSVVSDNFSVPEFTLDGYYDNKVENTTVLDPIYITDLAANPDFVTDPVPFEDIVYNIELYQTNIPKEVIDVKYADVTSSLRISFRYDMSEFPFEKVWITAGSCVDFPPCVIIDEAPEGFERVGDHKMVFKNDFPAYPSGSHADFPVRAIDFTKLPEGQGFIARGQFSADFDVIISGSIYVKARECMSEGLFHPEFESVISLEEAILNSVTASVEIDEDMRTLEQEFVVKDVPEYLKSDGTCLDFNALRLNLTIANNMPFNGLLSTAFATYSASGEQPLWNSHVDDLLLPSLSTASYSLSEDGSGAPQGYADVAVPGLNSFLRRMPDSYTVNAVVEPKDEYITIIPGAIYGMGLDYEFIAPMSFGPDFKLQISEEIHNLDVDIQEVAVTQAIVKLDVINAVPLAFTLEARAIDAEGNEIEGVTATIDRPITAGTLDSPTVNPVQITLSTQGRLSFEGIRLTVIADSPAEAPLNGDQYFMFDNISLHLPDGITYNN